MPSTAEGISTPEAGEDVNTQAGFEAALASKGVEPEAGDATADDTSIKSGLEVIEPGPTRTPDGKFAPEETAPDAPDTPTATDPLVAEYLAKYNGDADAAIKAAAHQQRLLGEQGNKLGEQAERLARLEGLVEGLKTAAPAATPIPPLSADEAYERGAEMIESQGYSAAATQAANLLLSTGDDKLYKAVIDAWSLESGYEASNHVADFRAWQRSQDAPAATPDPWVAQQKGVNQMGETLKAVAAEKGTSWARIEPHMLTALEQMPEAVASLVSSDDPAMRMAGINIVADRAAVLAGPVVAAEPGVPDSVTRKLAGSQVATGALRPPASTPAGQPQTKEEAISDFKRAIIETETTSVASGLTFGKPN